MSELPDETNPFSLANRTRFVQARRERDLGEHRHAGFVPRALFERLVRDSQALSNISDSQPLKDSDLSLCDRVQMTVTCMAQCVRFDQGGPAETYWSSMITEAGARNAAELELLPLASTFMDDEDLLTMYNAKGGVFRAQEQERATGEGGAEARYYKQYVHHLAVHALESFRHFQEHLLPERRRRANAITSEDYVTVRIVRNQMPKQEFARRTAAAEDELMNYLFGPSLLEIMRDTDLLLYRQLSRRSLDFASQASTLDPSSSRQQWRATFVSYAASTVADDRPTPRSVKGFVFDAEQTLQERAAAQRSVDADFAAIMDRLAANGFDAGGFHSGPRGLDIDDSGFGR